MFEEREMSIKELVIKALIRWRIILLVALLCAAAIPLLKYMKKADVPEETVASAEVLTHENTGALEDLYVQNTYLESQLQQYELLGIDPGSVKYIYLQYYINEDRKASTTDADKMVVFNDSEDITYLYGNYVKSDEFVNPIMKSVEAEKNEALYRQFIVVEVEGHNLRVQIPYTEEMDADKMISTAKTLIEDKSDDFQFAGAHSIKLISSGETEEKNSILVTEQNTLTTQRYNLNRFISILENEMTPAQINYAKKVAAGEIEDGEDLVAEASPVAAAPRFSKKYAVIGFVAGLFLMIVLFVVKEILSLRLQSAEELATGGKVLLFETMELPRKKKLLHVLDDALIYQLHSNKRKLTQEQQLAAVASAVTLYAEQNEIKKVCLTSTRFGQLDEDLMQKLVSALSKEHLEVKLVDDVAYDKDALRACAGADGTVLVEQVGKSVLTEIEKELKTAGEYKINVIGSIVLE